MKGKTKQKVSTSQGALAQAAQAVSLPSSDRFAFAKRLSDQMTPDTYWSEVKSLLIATTDSDVEHRMDVFYSSFLIAISKGFLPASSVDDLSQPSSNGSDPISVWETRLRVVGASQQYESFSQTELAEVLPVQAEFVFQHPPSRRWSLALHFLEVLRAGGHQSIHLVDGNEAK